MFNFFITAGTPPLSVPTNQHTVTESQNSSHRSLPSPKFWGRKPKATTKVTWYPTTEPAFIEWQSIVSRSQITPKIWGQKAESNY